MNHPTQQDIIAVDVSKAHLEVLTHVMPRSQRYSYDSDGMVQFFKASKGLVNPLLVLEATGGYERKLIAEANRQGVAICLVNPARIRAFTRSEGIKAKTDPIDVQMILKFATDKNLHPTPLPNSSEKQLEAFLDRRSQLNEYLTKEKNRLEKGVSYIESSIQKIIALIEAEISKIESAIRELIGQDQELHEKNTIIRSVKGVGEVTAWTILGYLREIETLNRNQLAALVGVAPYNKDSGSQSMKRSIYGGRAKVRRSLYMAATVAARHNVVIKPYVAGLMARGKPYKCAMIAAMRKLLIHIQSLLKKRAVPECSLSVQATPPPDVRAVGQRWGRGQIAIA